MARGRAKAPARQPAAPATGTEHLMTPMTMPSPEPPPNAAPLILVTGAARRVGAEIARQLHACGARVALHYRSSAGEAEALAAALNALRPDSAFTARGDLARFGAAEEIAAQVLARGEGLDGLVNNASSFFPTPVGRIDRAAWDELMGSNLMGPLFLSQATGRPFGTVFAGLGALDTYKQNAKSTALFTNNTWHATDALDLTLGLRYTREKKTLVSNYSNPNGGAGCGAGHGA